jgi:hypothetical protein
MLTTTMPAAILSCHKRISRVRFEYLLMSIQAHEASLDVRAWGDFFSQQGNVYYGEYPINFCASIGNVDIMNLLLEMMRQAGDTLRDYKDKHGNTALHMAVWHGKRDMYEYLAARFDKVQDEKNYCGLSPIELAASRGDGQMFQVWDETIIVRHVHEGYWDCCTILRG